MNLMPISDYPASASDSAQAQVMAERKGELTQKLQVIQQSGAPQAVKQSAGETIGSQIADADRSRAHHLREAAYQHKQETARVQQEHRQKAEQTQAQLEKADVQTAAVRRRLDSRA